jgi:hypothetical protein
LHGEGAFRRRFDTRLRHCLGPARLERPEHDAARPPGPAGAQRLPAGGAREPRPLDRVRRPPRRQSAEPAHRAPGRQWHLDRRRHRSAQAAVRRPHPGRAGAGRERRRADGARLQRRRAAESRQEQGVPAAHVRQPCARDMGRHDTGETVAHHGGRRQAEGHPQELVGVRHRHCLPGLGDRGLAHAAHDAGLRPVRPGAPALHPQLRPGGPGAGLEGGAGADRAARPHFHRTQGEPDLFRLRHEQARRDADRRPGEAARRTARADGAEPGGARSPR